MGGVKKRVDPTTTYVACLQGITEGKTQAEVRARLGITKPTLKNHLLIKKTSWAALLKGLPSKKPAGSVKKVSKIKIDKSAAITLELIEGYIVAGLMGTEVNNQLISIALKFLDMKRGSKNIEADFTDTSQEDYEEFLTALAAHDETDRHNKETPLT